MQPSRYPQVLGPRTAGREQAQRTPSAATGSTSAAPPTSSSSSSSRDAPQQHRTASSFMRTSGAAAPAASSSSSSSEQEHVRGMTPYDVAGRYEHPLHLASSSSEESNSNSNGSGSGSGNGNGSTCHDTRQQQLDTVTARRRAVIELSSRTNLLRGGGDGVNRVAYHPMIIDPARIDNPFASTFDTAAIMQTDLTRATSSAAVGGVRLPTTDEEFEQALAATREGRRNTRNARSSSDESDSGSDEDSERRGDRRSSATSRSRAMSEPRMTSSSSASSWSASTPTSFSSSSSLLRTTQTPQTPRTPRTPRRSRTPMNTPGSTRSSTSSASSRTSSTSQSVAEANYVVAISEFRGRQQVGLVAMDVLQRQLYLSQYGDSTLYSQTMMWIAHYMPRMILVPDVLFDSKLCRLIREEFPHLRDAIHGVRRRYYNESLGIESIRLIGTTKTIANLHLDQTSYLSTSCANAVIKFLEFTHNITFRPNTIQVFRKTLAGRMTLDHRTVQNLELVTLQRSASSMANDATIQTVKTERALLESNPIAVGGGFGAMGSSSRRSRGPAPRLQLSLFDIFTCQTSMGARLLRQNLIQPYIDEETLQTRLNLTELLLDETIDPEHQETFQAMTQLLASFNDLDYIVGGLTHALPRDVAKDPSQLKTAQRRVLQLLTLQSVVETMPALSALITRLLRHADEKEKRRVAMEERKRRHRRHHQDEMEVDEKEAPAARDQSLFDILNRIYSLLNSEHYHSLHGELQGLFDFESANQELAPADRKDQRFRFMFAIRKNINGMLDVSRRTFLEVVDDLRKEVKRLGVAWSLNPDELKLVYTNSRGYHLQMSEATYDRLETIQVSQLDQVEHRGNRVLCTTQKIISFDSRQSEAYDEVVAQAANVVEAVMDRIRERQSENLDWLSGIAESIAMIDIVLSFATLIARSSRDWVRPTFSTDESLVINQGRHPLLDATRQLPTVANDVNISTESNLKVITGANGSGKSTYLRMVGVINILAHIGCYVPAASAHIRLTDQIMTRMNTIEWIGLDDFSSYDGECRELAFILKSEATHPLILVSEREEKIDELGRGTSSLDGVALCWSSCEHLTENTPDAYTFLVTHFIELCQLPKLYPTIENLHLQCRTDTFSSTLRQMYKLVAGAVTNTEESVGYGIRTAQVAGMPRELIDDAKGIQTYLLKHVEQQSQTAPSTPRGALHIPSTIIPSSTPVQTSSTLSNDRSTSENETSSTDDAFHAMKRAFIDGLNAMHDEVERSRATPSSSSNENGSRSSGSHGDPAARMEFAFERMEAWKAANARQSHQMEI